MITVDPSAKWIQDFKKLANGDHPIDEPDEEFLVVDYVGSHVDDAYGLGEHHADILSARSVLTNLGIQWW